MNTDRIIYKTKTDALVRDPSSIARKPLPDARRRPLGLAIIDGPDDDSAPPDRSHAAEAQAIVAESVERLGENADSPARVKDIFELGIAMTLESSFDDREFACELVRKLRREIADGQGAQRSEVAELKLTITELRCEIREMRAIQEQARIASRGEQGAIGPRGIPGPPGPHGQRGEKGDAGPRPAGFITNPDDFSAMLVLTDGSPGPTLRMRSLFDAYDSQVNGDET